MSHEQFQRKAQAGQSKGKTQVSHVGMIAGHNAVEKLLVCHCPYGMNNVVVTEFSASGFTAVGRQPLIPG